MSGTNEPRKSVTDDILSFWRDGPLSSFATLFDEAPIKMHAIDSVGVLVDVSAFWADSLGYTRDEMIGTKSTDYLTAESREYASTVVLRKFFEEGRIRDVEYDFVRKDGTILPVLMSAVAQTDKNGKFLHSIAIMFDITETKATRALLEQKQRMEAVGRLVGGVAHDFNNLLMVIRGNLEFLNADMDDPERATYLGDAMSAAQRGAHLVHQLMSYGRKVHLSPRKLDLNVVVRDAESMLRRLLPANTGFEIQTKADLWTAMVDRGQLETAVLNLVTNAKDAMVHGGTIKIETANVELDDEFAQNPGEDISPGRYVTLTVRDEGEGMSEDVQRHAFEPFFTTKPQGVGSGLGLSMVQGFVQQSSGAVRVASTAGEGTEIKLYFPAIDGAPELKSVPPPKTETLDFPKAKILVVEDESDVRRVLVRQLAHAGLDITEARSGDAALALLQDGFRPDLLIADLVMPGSLQGNALGRAAREIVEGVKIIFISGYPKDQMSQGGSDDVPVEGDHTYLLKPINRDELLTAVQSVLGPVPK